MSSEHRIKVIFDTNIWISYLIGYQLGGLTGLINVSQVNFLVTGDQDLLILNPFGGAEIIEPNQLLEKIADR